MAMRNPPHPGGILKRQYLDPLGLSVTATAKALGVSRKQLSQLLNERAGISPEMSIRLGLAFSTTPEFWINLQRNRELWLAKRSFTTPIPSLYKKGSSAEFVGNSRSKLGGQPPNPRDFQGMAPVSDGSCSIMEDSRRLQMPGKTE